MRRIIYFVALLLLGSSTAVSAQTTTDLKLGVHAGLPVGEMDEFFNFNAGVDVAYLFGVAGIVEVGPMAGYLRYFGDSGEDDGFDWEVDDASFLPLAASGRVDLGPVFAGVDLGYAIGIDDGNDGGFFYRPKVGFGFMGLNLVGSYSGISLDGVELNSVNLGLEFGF